MHDPVKIIRNIPAAQINRPANRKFPRSYMLRKTNYKNNYDRRNPKYYGLFHPSHLVVPAKTGIHLLIEIFRLFSNFIIIHPITFISKDNKEKFIPFVYYQIVISNHTIKHLIN